jgi:YVTN family beta-propeller protein
VIDLMAGKLKQRFLADLSENTATTPLFASFQGSFTGILYSRDGTQLYASDASGSVVVANVSADGTLSHSHRIALPVADPKRGASLFVADGRNTANPGGLALSGDGRRLYVALNMNNSLAEIDLARRAVAYEIPVGNAPHSVIVDGAKAYVTNEGGRKAEASDFTNPSAGTPIVADPNTGRPVSGTVSVVDLNTRKVTGSISVGLHPTKMLLHEGYLFVANTNSDTVSVIDTRRLAVIKTIAIQPFFDAPFGSSPDALAMVSQDRLAVSLGGNNAVAFYDWQGPSTPSRLLGLIPTAWYPSDLVMNSKRNQLLVSTLKGMGSDPADQGANYVLHLTGSLSLIRPPTRAQLVDFTRQVISNNGWGEGPAPSQSSEANTKAKAIPDRIGDPSLIKHVIYIIKENKTYDQVFGDDSRGNGEPKFLQFGPSITPNAHALAAQFPLFDNFYVASLASADGHQWANSAFVDDYVERGFAYGFQRSYPFNGGDSLAYVPTGFLWENAMAHAKSVRVFGEFAPRFDGPIARYGHWADWYRDALIMGGKLTGEQHVRPGEFQTKSDIPSLDGILDRDFPPYDTHIPDQYRVEVFLADFKQRLASNDLPDLTIMQLCNDHTSGVAPQVPTPRAQIADNDLALGRVVEAVSNSKYWRDTAIFVVEDDAAGGLDHVDGHRSPAFAISPYARHGYVDHTYYTQIDVVRTIEQILGLPPMNQHDLAAAAMSTAFTDSPDLTPYKALANRIPLDEMNPATSAGRIERAWQQESAKMFSAWPRVPDAPDPNLLNRAIWYGTNGFARPYPGDNGVLFPGEVVRSKRRD